MNRDIVFQSIILLTDSITLGLSEQQRYLTSVLIILPFFNNVMHSEIVVNRMLFETIIH